MRLKRAFKGMGLAAAIVGLGTGLVTWSSGCSSSVGAGTTTVGADGVEMGSSPALPAMDVEVPGALGTASFAYG